MCGHEVNSDRQPSSCSCCLNNEFFVDAESYRERESNPGLVMSDSLIKTRVRSLEEENQRLEEENQRLKLDSKSKSSDLKQHSSQNEALKKQVSTLTQRQKIFQLLLFVCSLAFLVALLV
jgi:regulator of replication initiation timing